MNIAQQEIVERMKLLQAQIKECENNFHALHGRLAEMKELLNYVAAEEAKSQEVQSIEATPENIVTPVEELAEEQPCESNTN